MKIRISFKKGFSIGEVLIALFILSFGIIAAIYLMTGSMKDTMRARDLLVAEKLSQEGVELVKNIRDNNATEKNVTLNKRDSVFEGFPIGNDDCTVDYNYDVNNTNNQGKFRSALDCSPSSFNLYLVEKKGNLFYTHQKSSSKLTKFRRKIIIKTVSEGKKNIYSIVIWGDNDFPSNMKDCTIGQDCIFTENTLTAWLDFSK